MTAITLPFGLLAWAAGQARAHPAHAAATVTAGSAAVAAAVVLAPSAPAHHPHPAAPASPPRPAAVITELSIGGQPVPQASAGHSIRSMIGEPARASGVTVQSVAAHNGFWVGTARGRLWVELVGPLKPLRARPQDHVRFTGTVVGHQPSFAARAGVTPRAGARLLTAQGAHIDVKTTNITVVHAR